MPLKRRNACQGAELWYTRERMPTKILTVLEWSKKNGVSVRNVRRLIRAGKIPTRNIIRPIIGISETFKLKDKQKAAK